MKWARKAADQGLAGAQFSLGSMYLAGEGVPQNYAEAMKWYRKAADQGDETAQLDVGVMYRDGKGVPENYAEAMKWLRKAADQGNETAQLDVGSMYENGQGVLQDYVQAHMWFNLAAASIQSATCFGEYSDLVPGCDAAKGRDRVAAKMNPAQIAEAQRLAASWRKDVASVPGPSAQVSASSSMSVPLESIGGTFVVPVLINGKINLDFTIDSGASDVSIPADVVMTLMRTGTLTESDFQGSKTYTLADGSTVPSETFMIRSLRVGDKTLVDVTGSVASVKGELLLGQSFLSRFKSWSIDNQRQVLILN
jgi:clan AA aspartic protease (TIGR02281 family)